MQKFNSKTFNHLSELTVTGDPIRFTGNTLAIIYEEAGLDSIIIQNLRFGAIQYGLYQREHIPFLLIEMADLRFDFAIDAYDLLPSIHRNRLNYYQGNISFTIVLPKSHRVVVKRNFWFNTHFTDHLKSCLQSQLKYYHNESEVRKRISELTEFLVTEEM